MEAVATIFTQISPYVTVIGSLGTIIALVVSRRHEGGIKALHESLSTRYIDKFPDYIPEITNEVEKCSKSLVVMCTFPQHGAFSSPAAWENLEKAVREKIKDESVTVKMLFSSSSQRLIADRKQFNDAFDGWEDWRARNRERLRDYVTENGGARERTKICNSNDGEDCTIKDVYDWLWFQDESEKQTVADWLLNINVTKKKTQIFETPKTMPVFAWLIDETKAIFSFMTYDGDIGHAFSTCDQGFVKSLTKLVERYANESEVRDFNIEPASRQAIFDELEGC